METSFFRVWVLGNSSYKKNRAKKRVDVAVNPSLLFSSLATKIVEPYVLLWNTHVIKHF